MKKAAQNRWMLIPMMIWIAIIPLIVKVKFMDNTLIDYPWANSQTTIADFFLYYKSVLVVITGVLMIACLAWKICSKKDSVPILNADTYIFIPIFAYVLLAIVSSVLSDTPYFCVHGMPEQFESVWCLIAYVVAVIYFYYIVRYQDNEQNILRTLYIGAFLVGFICVLQYFKIDIYRFMYEKKGYSFTFEKGTVYGPFYNINYVGSYVLLLLPIFALTLIYIKDKKEKSVSVILCVLLLIALYGSKSTTPNVAAVIVLAFAISFLILKRMSTRRGRIAVGCILAFIIIGTGIGSIPYIQSAISASNTEKRTLKHIYTNNENIEVDYNGHKMYIQLLMDESTFQFILADESQTTLVAEYCSDSTGNYYVCTDERFQDLKIAPVLISEDPVIYGFQVSMDDKDWTFSNQINDDGSYYYISPTGKAAKLTPEIEVADSSFFADMSSLASGRGYIWNKTVTLMKQYIILGSGADTYALVFPNGDFVDKYNNGYDNMNVTKPHNLYMQIAIQTGLVSLVCFLIFYLWYFVVSLRLYFKVQFDTPLSVLGFGIMLGTLGYMISGLANDSTVTVAPIYWALLGMGIGINHKLRLK